MVLRKQEQLVEVLTPVQMRCAIQNVRNVTLPTKNFDNSHVSVGRHTSHYHG